jgi:hypothetical protein
LSVSFEFSRNDRVRCFEPLEGESRFDRLRVHVSQLSRDLPWTERFCRMAFLLLLENCSSWVRGLRAELNDLKWRARNNAAESVKEEGRGPSARSPLGAQWAQRYILHYYTNNTREWESASGFSRTSHNAEWIFIPRSDANIAVGDSFVARRRHRRYLFWLEKSSSSRPRGHFSHWQNRLLRKLPRITIYPLPPALGNPLFSPANWFLHTRLCIHGVSAPRPYRFFYVTFDLSKWRQCLKNNSKSILNE